ncbi:hypothetical protein ACWCQL_37335 [Streptomyces sp. NPDC002073]
MSGKRYAVARWPAAASALLLALLALLVVAPAYATAAPPSSPAAPAGPSGPAAPTEPSGEGPADPASDTEQRPAVRPGGRQTPAPGRTAARTDRPAAGRSVRVTAPGRVTAPDSLRAVRSVVLRC